MIGMASPAQVVIKFSVWRLVAMYFMSVDFPDPAFPDAQKTPNCVASQLTRFVSKIQWRVLI